MELPSFDEPPDDQGVHLRKKVLAKCIRESLNRYVFQEIKKIAIELERNISKAPMLLANPQGLKFDSGLTRSEAAEK